jgi:hypothetical protein
MKDPVVTAFAAAATAMHNRLIRHITIVDLPLVAAVFAARKSGHRSRISLTVGGGYATIELAMIDEHGHANRVATIDAEDHLLLDEDSLALPQ